MELRRAIGQLVVLFPMRRSLLTRDSDDEVNNNEVDPDESDEEGPSGTSSVSPS